jgi:hypothetical protein
VSEQRINTEDKTATTAPDSAETAPVGPPTMSAALMPTPHYDANLNELIIPTPFSGGNVRFTPGERRLTAKQMAILGPASIRPDYDAMYVAAFLADCHARGLDPWSGEAYLMRYKGSTDGPTYVRHIGIYGFLRLAEGTGGYEGMDQVLYQGEAEDKWMEVWKYRDEPPFAAKVTSYRTGRRPQPVVTLYDEYAPMVDEKIQEKRPDGSTKVIYTGRKVPAPMWRTGREGGKASAMLAKVDRAASLRLLFPRKFGGFYEPAELEKSAAEARSSHPDDGETAQARRAAYADARRTVDGADVGATVRETITVTASDDAGTAEADVRALLLAELDAQARLLGYDREALTRRWSAARDGQDFATATIATMTGHVHRYREYLVGKLRDTGRHRLAEKYHTAPLVGTLEALFGTAAPWDVPADTDQNPDAMVSADVPAEVTA